MVTTVSIAFVNARSNSEVRKVVIIKFSRTYGCDPEYVPTTLHDNTFPEDSNDRQLMSFRSDLCFLPWGNHIQRVKIVMNDNIIEQVTDFKYLGYRISEYGSDLEDKLQTYNKINGAIRRHFGKQMNKETKLRIHNITAKAALKFGSEAWVLKKREEQRLQAAQMKVLRHLLGITKLGKEKKHCIRQKMGAQNILKEIKQYQKKWVQHVQRMDTNRLPKVATTCT